MVNDIIMPKAGMAMETGKIVKWLVKEGDKVSVGDMILEIETDKVNMEVESFSSGTVLKILAHEGEEIPVTQVIGYIGDPGDAIPKTAAPAPKPAAAPKAPPAQSIPAPAESAAAKAQADYDVIVVGGGPAGYVCAIKAAQLGGKVALVEKDVVGGTCLNRGCIPAKTYLKTAEILTHIRGSAYRGITVASGAVKFDMKTARQDKARVVKKLTGGVASLLKSNGVDVLHGTGTVGKDKTVSVGGQKLSAASIVFCGGSQPSAVPIPGADSKYVVTSNEMFELETVPQRLVVIGGGVIGAELSQAFSAFGSRVTIIEMMDRITPFMDEEVSGVLHKELKKSGIEIMTSARVESIEETKDGAVVSAGGQKIKADLVLMSVGRSPDLSGIQDAGVVIQNGRVVVDDMLRTSVPGIFAAGDVTGTHMLAHAAFKMGEIAAANALGASETYTGANIPACIYTAPEASGIGLTELEAKKGHDVAVGRFPFSANGRALASGEPQGMIKVITDRKYGEVLGVHIVGPGAAEMANEASLMMAMEVTASEMAEVVHAHPTFSEALMEAAADAAGVCVHLPPKK